MLKNTFRHLSGFGALKERRLWSSGILDWDIYERVSFRQLRLFHDTGIGFELEESRRALEKGEVGFFASRLPRAEHYRIALSYPAEVLFLDIETTGLSLYYDQITVIGVSLGGEYRFHVAGQPISPIADRIERAKCVVTFNGTLFDLKFLRQQYPELPIPEPHVDLRYLARAVGLTGGQKEIERLLGFEREGVGEISGESAPLLWHEYRMGKEDAFRALIEYNRADVEGMKAILDVVVDRLAEQRGVPTPEGRMSFSRLAAAPLEWANGGQATTGALRVPALIGRTGPKITFDELLGSVPGGRVRVVGIDLTGSSARPTGWALLDGVEASTARLGTDESIMQRTLDTRPALVSIDSPLSVPRGRKLFRNGNSTREVGSIVRDCERLLKRRGINVYPCLLPSMRTLTERGIRLATFLRAEGVPVIESYPGAAQDIMRIPRKRAGLQYLIRGLADFGVRGDFVQGNVTHDEVDAITSALVYDYVRATGMIHPFNRCRLSKPASYEVSIGRRYIYWDSQGRNVDLFLKEDEEFVLAPNSIGFVTPEEFFQLPNYIAARFNLRITNVHRGLLLGTGPLVDPGFPGQLLVPLHNLTTNEYHFRQGEQFA